MAAPMFHSTQCLCGEERWIAFAGRLSAHLMRRVILLYLAYKTCWKMIMTLFDTFLFYSA